jgi:hypothetical protein
MNKNTWYPAIDAVLFNPNRYSFKWNEDYSMFQATPLLWWDDASYIAYQGDQQEDDGMSDSDALAELKEDEMRIGDLKQMISVDHPKWQIIHVKTHREVEDDIYETRSSFRLPDEVYNTKEYALRKASLYNQRLEVERPDMFEDGDYFSVVEIEAPTTSTTLLDDSLPF